MGIWGCRLTLKSWCTLPPSARGKCLVTTRLQKGSGWKVVHNLGTRRSVCFGPSLAMTKSSHALALLDRRIARSTALPQPCEQAFPSRWAAGEAGAAFSDASSAAPGTAFLPPGVASFSPRRRPSPGSPVLGFGLTSRPAPLRGRGCRSRAARPARPERRRGRHEPARAHPSRWAGPEPARRAVAQAVRPDA